MTTIIAMQDDDGVRMMADTQITASGIPYFHADMQKVIQRGQYLLGITGHLVALQAIQSSWNPPTWKPKFKGTLYDFILTNVIPSLKAFVGEQELITGNFEEDVFSLLLAINGEVFEIDQDFSVSRREDGIYAIGTGSAYAMGALLAGAFMDEAMEIAATMDLNTHDPFVEMTQDKAGQIK